MSTTEPHIRNAAPALKDLVFAAVDHAMDLIQKHRTTLQPYALINSGSQTQIQLFYPADLAEGPKMFEKTIREMTVKPDNVVFCSDGFVHVGNMKVDAVLVRAYDKNDGHCYTMAQRYQPESDGSPFEVIGNPVFMRAEPNQLTYGG